jgi:hypothetical protein
MPVIICQAASLPVSGLRVVELQVDSVKPEPPGRRRAAWMKLETPIIVYHTVTVHILRKCCHAQVGDDVLY